MALCGHALHGPIGATQSEAVAEVPSLTRCGGGGKPLVVQCHQVAGAGISWTATSQLRRVSLAPQSSCSSPIPHPMALAHPQFLPCFPVGSLSPWGRIHPLEMGHIAGGLLSYLVILLFSLHSKTNLNMINAQ